MRFVHLYHRGWDHHGGLANYMKICCGLTDRPTWALLTDLKQRGLLEDTLVIWGGEFGRTPMFQGKGELAGIIISKAFPCGWRGVESRVASATERRTSSGIMRRKTPFTCVICMPPCSISSESTTKISVSNTRVWTRA